MTIVEFFYKAFENNVLSGIVGGSFAISLLYMLRNIPIRIYNLLRQFFVAEIVIFNDNAAFHEITNWLETTSYARKTKKLRVRWDSEDGKLKFLFSPGIGTHIIWFKKRPILIIRTEKETQTSVQYIRPENLYIRTICSSNDIIHEFIDHILKEIEEINKYKLKIYIQNQGGWCILFKKKKSFSSIILPQNQINKITNAIEKFMNSEKWYEERGIPYRLGILLYGPPGCGKTSLAIALASKYNKPIYVINLTSISGDSELINIMSKLPQDCILLIEDIDAIKTKRKDIQTNEHKNQIKTNMSLSGLLNAIDGVFSTENRILIMTTNHPELIDPALIRPGRADIHELIDKLAWTEIQRMCRLFIPDTEEADKIAKTIQAPIAAAELQQILLGHQSPIAKNTTKNKHNGIHKANFSTTI